MTVQDGTNRDAWLKLRTMGIGGSDAGTIVGDNPWKSPYALWLEKTGQLVPEDISGTDPVYWGTTLEDIVAREFTKRTGKRVRRCGTMQSNDVPWMLANVDRLIIGEKAGLECKTTNAFNIKAWQDDGLPNAYYWQCQHYMMVTGLSAWYIAVLIGGQHYDYKRIPRNDDDIDYLAQKEKEFWDRVQTMTPPPIDGSRSTTETIQGQYPGGQTEPVELPQEAAEALALIDNAKAERKRLDDVIMTQENVIKCLMGDDEIATIGDRKVTWKNQKGRIAVDTKKLKKEFPDVYEACMKQGKPTRRFLV
jgi:putative phage-type endonuclease